MGGQHAEPFRLAGRPEGAAQCVVQSAGAVVGRAELQLPGAFGDPRRVLEYAAEGLDEAGLVHARRAQRRGLVGMVLLPVAGDVDAARQPHLVVALDVVDEALQRRHTPGTADQAAMQADRHHLGLAGLALGVERVEGVLQVGEELLAFGEAGLDGEAHVVGVERVGDDELRRDGVAMAVMVEPVGQVVVIGVGNIVETAFGSRQPHRPDRSAAQIHALRPFAHHFRMQPDRLHHVGALGLLVMVAIVDPLQAVRGDFPVRGLHGGHLVGRARESGGDAVDGDRHLCPGEQAVQAPEAGAGPVFVDGFHVPMAQARPWRSTRDLRQEGLRGLVAVEDAVLAAFLVVDHELHGHMGATGPGRIGWIGSVTTHVAHITHRR